jgi:hypothetical protein
MLAPLLPEFMAANPQVRVQLLVANRRVDLIPEGIDVALRVRTRLDEDGELVLRRFGQVPELLVAEPGLPGRARPPDASGRTRRARDPERQRGRIAAALDPARAADAVVRVDIRPVLMTQDFGVLMAAAKAGQGIALLPETVCADAVRAGELKLVFRDWQLPQGICHAVYPFAPRRAAGGARVDRFPVAAHPGVIESKPPALHRRRPGLLSAPHPSSRAGRAIPRRDCRSRVRFFPPRRSPPRRCGRSGARARCRGKYTHSSSQLLPSGGLQSWSWLRGAR